MGDIDVNVYYNIYRLEALQTALKGQGQSVQDAVSASLDALYEKMVPEQVRRDIEDRIVQEYAQARAEAEAARRYSVLRLKYGEDTFYLLDEDHTSLYSFARMYRVTLQPKLADKSLWNVLGCFIKADRLLEVDYNRLAGQVGEHPQITMAADVDMDKGTLYYRDKGMKAAVGYSLRALSTAAFRADRKYGLSQNVREDIFFENLEGKALNIERPVEEQESEPSMQM